MYRNVTRACARIPNHGQTGGQARREGGVLRSGSQILRAFQAIHFSKPGSGSQALPCLSVSLVLSYMWFGQVIYANEGSASGRPMSAMVLVSSIKCGQTLALQNPYHVSTQHIMKIVHLGFSR